MLNYFYDMVFNGSTILAREALTATMELWEECGKYSARKVRSTRLRSSDQTSAWAVAGTIDDMVKSVQLTDFLS